MMNDLYIILTGIFLVLSTATLGCFLVLRRMVMMGDAISHALLPGIIIAFLVSQSRGNLWMLTGACATGLLVTMMVQMLHHQLKIHRDASMGISFTTLFAIGIILITRYTSQVDLDPECVLYGEIAYVPLDLWISSSGQNFGPKALYLLGGAAVIVLTCVMIGYRGLMLTSFDPEYAHQIGLRTRRWHYGLMILVSLTIVTAFEVVGAILVVAFLVIPSATAYLITKRLAVMLMVSCLMGITAVLIGYGMAIQFNGSIAAAMAIASGLLFVLTLFISKSFILKRHATLFSTTKDP